MKNSRGRPKGRKYSRPRTCAEGFDIATYGKIGGTEAMSILRHCPHPTIKFIAETDPETQSRMNRKFLDEWATELTENWERQMGMIIGQKVASGDVEFFRQLADAVEEFSKTEREIE